MGRILFGLVRGILSSGVSLGFFRLGWFFFGTHDESNMKVYGRGQRVFGEFLWRILIIGCAEGHPNSRKLGGGRGACGTRDQRMPRRATFREDEIM